MHENDAGGLLSLRTQENRYISNNDGDRQKRIFSLYVVLPPGTSLGRSLAGTRSGCGSVAVFLAFCSSTLGITALATPPELGNGQPGLCAWVWYPRDTQKHTSTCELDSLL